MRFCLIDIPWDIVETGEALGVLRNTYFFGDEKLAGSRTKSEDVTYMK